jgi:hypothetical protein
LWLGLIQLQSKDIGIHIPCRYIFYHFNKYPAPLAAFEVVVLFAFGAAAILFIQRLASNSILI